MSIKSKEGITSFPPFPGEPQDNKIPAWKWGALFVGTFVGALPFSLGFLLYLKYGGINVSTLYMAIGGAFFAAGAAPIGYDLLKKAISSVKGEKQIRMCDEIPSWKNLKEGQFLDDLISPGHFLFIENSDGTLDVYTRPDEGRPTLRANIMPNQTGEAIAKYVSEGLHLQRFKEKQS